MAAGSIVRLKLKHFMTYDAVEITPCPGLNLITGPNGTGKSTLLCAMCLGLAGKPSSIGRSERISDFIKNGFDQAYIEIELLNPDGANITIGRLINSSNTSHWTLNGKAASLKMVEKEIARFNIQTNNMCQFLPQEKVADFTKMNQKELLESTEQAVGDQSMYDNHTKLKQMRTDYCELENSLNAIKENVEREKEKNKRLEGEVKQHKEREKYLKRIKNIEKKIPWMKYEKVRDDYVAKGEEKKRLTEEYKKSSENLEPMRKEIEELKQEVSQTIKSTESLDREIRKKKSQVTVLMQNLEEVDSKIADTKYEFDDKKKEERRRVEELQKGKTVVRNLEEELREAQAEDSDSQAQLQEITEEAKQIQYHLLQAHDDKQNSRMKQVNDKQNLEDIKKALERHRQGQSHRFNLLKIKEPDAYKAILWLRENQNLFKKKIYEPILTLIHVPELQSVKYIESHIAYRDLTAFFAEDRDDMNHFLNILCDKEGLNISGIHSAPVPEQQLQPRMSVNQLQHFGLTHYLKELFTAPPPVMNYLCKNYRLHDIPVGYDYNRNKIKTILENRRFPFNKFFMGDFVYRLKTSKYGDHCQSSVSQKITDIGLLRGSVDTVEIDLLEEKQKKLEIAIQEQEVVYSSLCQNEMKYNSEIERLRVKKKKLMERKDLVKNLSAKIHSKKEQLKFLENPLCDIEEEERRLSQLIVLSIQKKVEMFNKLNVLFEQIFLLEKEKSLKCFAHYFLVTKKNEAEKALTSASAEFHSLQQSFQQIKSVIGKLKLEVQTALGHAKKAIGLNVSDDIPQDLKSKLDEFQDLPNDVAELQSEMSREQAKLNCIYRTNPGVIKEFVDREKHINEKKEAIAVKENELKDLEENINGVKDQWLPAIEMLIEKISTNFSRYFATLGCAGEVTLDKTDNPNDFHKYGISIRVKFRDDEPLNQLSHAHHSGGECSVSTILFILSLQELTEVPFRCVDEINQGMDNINERSVFDLIVKSSCSKKKSQYFLITPKLLHGLEYPPEMEIAIIHNGSSKRCHWDISKFLRIRSSLGS